MGHQKTNNECASLEEVRSICGGDYALADQVVEILEREARCAREEERAEIVNYLFQLSSPEKAPVLVRLCNYDEKDPSFCLLVERVLVQVAQLIQTGKKLEEL